MCLVMSDTCTVSFSLLLVMLLLIKVDKHSMLNGLNHEDSAIK